MWRSASSRFLRGGGYRLPSQTLPVGYSENVLPLIRKFCSAPIERITDGKGDGEFQGQDAADMPLDRSDSDSEARHADGGICGTRKGLLEKQGPRKLHETKTLVSEPWASQEAHYHRTKLSDKAFKPRLLQVVLDTPANALRTVLDKWVGDGNSLETNDLLIVYSHLRKRHKRRKALQFVEWVERGELLNFEERDYASHLQSLAYHNGIEAAQKYIERVPKSFRNQVLYETLLASCVRVAHVQKAEEVFQEIMNLSLPLTVSACNQMVLLYKKVALEKASVARKKVDDILMLMEKENVKPSPFTYRLLIELNVQSNDTSGMEAVLDMMKADGVEPNVVTQTTIAKFYISGGLTEKAEETIKAMEVYVNDKPRAVRSLMDLYCILGRPDDVARIWKLCTEPKPSVYLATIKAWGKLGHIKQAEETFESLLKRSRKLTSSFFNAMLNVYAENKLLSKGKELLERMHSAGCPSDPLTWDAICDLYVNSGEVEKAESFLLNEADKNADRSPLLCSYIKILKAYEKKGDIHSSKKIFDRLKKVGYRGKFTSMPFRERMRADQVLPARHGSNS